MMRRIIIISLILISAFAHGQVYVNNPAYGTNFKRANFITVLQIPADTTLDGTTNPCSQIAKIDNVIYTYNCDSVKWVQIVGAAQGIQLALDSARRSNDTLFFRYTTGGELAVKMDYYTKGESDSLYTITGSNGITVVDRDVQIGGVFGDDGNDRTITGRDGKAFFIESTSDTTYATDDQATRLRLRSTGAYIESLDRTNGNTNQLTLSQNGLTSTNNTQTVLTVNNGTLNRIRIAQDSIRLESAFLRLVGSTRADSIGIGKRAQYKFDLVDGNSIMRFDGKRLSLAYDTVTNQSMIIGHGAGSLPDNLYRSTALGTLSLFGASGLNLTSAGHSSGFGSVGNDNTFFGNAAGLRMRGSHNTAIGNQSLYSSDSSDNTSVGDRSALGAYVIRSTFIGAKSTVSANDYVGSIGSAELGSTSGTLTSKGPNTAALITAGGLTIGQIRAVRIDFSQPYPAANTDSFRAIICKAQVAGSDSLVYLSQGAFTYAGSGGIAKLSKVLSNVSVLGANGAADKSNQVVLGDTLNEQIKSGVIRIKTNQAPDTAQVLAWNGTEFIPSDHMVSLKDFGAIGDGVTNDSAALARAAAYFNLRGGGTLYVPKGTYFVSKTVDGTIARFRFLNGFRLEATGALFTNDNYKDSEWNSTSFTSTGLVATAVTATPHGYMQDSTILVKNATDSNYNGSFTVSSVIDPYTFTYPIWQSTPNSATGISHDNGYRRILFEFDSCQNVVLNGLRYKGTVQPINNQYRLGWVALKLQQHSSNITVNDMNVEGASYGIWSGFYNVDEGGFSKGKIYMTAKNVGYPVALWKSGDESYFNLRSENVHRGVYIGSTNNSKFDIYTKNYDIAGALITSQPLNSTTLAGCRNLIVNVYDDSSRAKPTFYPFIGPRTIAVISGYNVVGATCQFKNINIHIESTGSNYVQGPLLNTTTPLTSLDGITVSGYMNRALSDPAQIYSELTIGNESALIAGAFSNIKVQDYKVINSTVGGTVRPAVISVKTLGDNIQLNNYSSTAAMTVSLPTGRYLEYNNTTAGTTNQRITESETTKDIVLSTTSVLGTEYKTKVDSAGMHVIQSPSTTLYDFPNISGRPMFSGLHNVAALDSVLTTDASGNVKMWEVDHLDNFVKQVADSGVSTSTTPRSNNSGFGAYTSTATATGYPVTTGAGAGGGIVYQRSTLNSNNGIGSFQFWCENTPNDSLVYFRKRVSTSRWSNWMKIYHEGYKPVLPFTNITGTVPIAQGGTGLTALGSALQQLRVNAGATALEYFTPSTPTLSDVTTAGATTSIATTFNSLLTVTGKIKNVLTPAGVGTDSVLVKHASDSIVSAVASRDLTFNGAVVATGTYGYQNIKLNNSTSKLDRYSGEFVDFVTLSTSSTNAGNAEYYINTDNTARTIVIPVATGDNQGRRYTIINSTNDTGGTPIAQNITVDLTTNSVRVNGSTSNITLTPGQSLTIVSNGAQWYKH